jgi:hypothetical protein
MNQISEEIWNILSRDRTHPKQWARDIRDAHREGTGLTCILRATGDVVPIGPQPVSALQVQLAREALGREWDGQS